jgi:hypothetical protein
VTLPPELNAKTVELVWSHHLDAFIEQHLGRVWSTQQNDYYGQETLVSFEVYPDPDDTAVVQAWIDSPPAMFPGRLDQNEPAGEHWGAAPDATLGESVDIYTGQILNELCNRGLLPEGDLMVHVWW